MLTRRSKSYSQGALIARKVSKAKAEVIAQALVAGESKAEACRLAGYSETTAAHHATELCAQAEVVEILRRNGESIPRDTLSAVAKARLAKLLTDPNAGSRELVPAIRLALEQAGEVGQRDIAVKHELALPPVLHKLLLEEFNEMQRQRTVEGAIVHAGS